MQKESPKTFHKKFQRKFRDIAEWITKDITEIIPKGIAGGANEEIKLNTKTITDIHVIRNYT